MSDETTHTRLTREVRVAFGTGIVKVEHVKGEVTHHRPYLRDIPIDERDAELQKIRAEIQRQYPNDKIIVRMIDKE